MNLEEIAPGRAESGASLGAMLILLDLRPETVQQQCGTDRLQTAMQRCLACPTHDTCAHWIADGWRRRDAWQGFCPNADMLQSALQPKPGLR